MPYASLKYLFLENIIKILKNKLEITLKDSAGIN